jgi:tRNA threonylcarbamoyladenosine biosynthesis protein TsaB
MPRGNVAAERILAIETSSPCLSLALGDEKRVLAIYTGAQNWRHAETLFDGIKKLLARVHWPVQSLTGIAASVGPGSFTGIRIGLAAARAFGQTLAIPVVGISSLETMAEGAPAKARWLMPQIDALRGQIFSALYERVAQKSPHAFSLRRVLAETMAQPDLWMRQVKRRADRQPLWISPLQGCYPEAKVLLALARSQLAKAGPESYRSVLPLYIRKAAAEERR